MRQISQAYRSIFSEKFRIVIRNIQYWLIHKIELYESNKFAPDYTSKWHKSVCFILPSAKTSGGVLVVCEYASRLEALGVKVIVATLDGATNLPQVQMRKLAAVSWVDEKQNILKEFDTVVATGWLTAYAAASSGIKRAFYFVQSDERRFYPNGSYLKKRVEDTYKLPFRYITIASWMQKWLKDEFGQDARVIRNGLDIDIFRPDGPRIEPKPGNKIRILIEGAIDLPFKGVGQAIDVVQDLPKNKYEIWLVSSSGEPDPKWKIDRFFYKVPQKTMGEIYRSCHVLLKLSTVEGMAGPPLEAMACGCVPVIRKVTGSEEYLIDGVNGFYFESSNDNLCAVVAKASDLLANTDFLGRVEKVTRKFDWVVSSKMMEEYLSGELV